MSYLVLARKYRPQTFGTVVGQEHISTALANAIVRDRVPHALLFTGPRGVGKTSTARVFAKALNCTSRQTDIDTSSIDDTEARASIEPCGECSNCKEISRSASLAVWEIDGASNNSVDNVRELIDSLYSLPPPGARYKIYIIDEVHMLSVAAFNALLKSLEEPPPNTIFVFATTEPHKIPETVISRCQRHDFRRISSSEIAARLRDISVGETAKIEDEVFDFIARKASGSMRDAQSMLDRLFAFSTEGLSLSTAQSVFGVVDWGFFDDLAEAVLSQNIEESFLLLDKAFSQSLDTRAFAADFLTYWRNALLLKLAEESSSGTERLRRSLELSPAEISQLKNRLNATTGFDLQRIFDIARETVDDALRSDFSRFVFEAGVAKMASLPALRPLAEIISSLETGASFEQKAVPLQQVAASQTPQVPTPTPASTTTPTSSFNPSWHAFVNHVKSRSEMVLAAFLRRVSPKRFTLGLLEFEADEFDLGSMKEGGMLESLKACLYSYSGEQNWEIDYRQAEQNAHEPSQSNNHVVEGSLVAKEAKERRNRSKQIEDEARSQKAVKDVLSTFDGSQVDKVSQLKR